ncbi:hypothetical protein NLU03_30780 [Bacillus toyonensis]|nr:hypothetical protein [Bacillus toyonensis]
MTWNTLKTKEDLEELLQLFGDFHDSCLKEVYMWTDSYVDENGIRDKRKDTVSKTVC